MTGQVVDPALLPQLGHYGINPWKTCLGFSPFSQSFWVLVPRDAHTDWVAFHLIKSWVGGGSSVEKFPPQQLTIEGERGRAVFLYLPIEVCEFEIEEAAGETAETEVGTQASRTG